MNPSYAEVVGGDYSGPLDSHRNAGRVNTFAHDDGGPPSH